MGENSGEFTGNLQDRFLSMLVILIWGAIVLMVVLVGYYGSRSAADEAGIKPDSPFYALDLLIEKFDLLGTKDEEEKVKKLTVLIEEKLNEAASLIKDGEASAAKKSLKVGDNYISDALSVINSLKSELKNIQNNTKPSASPPIGRQASQKSTGSQTISSAITEQKISDLTQDLGEAVLKKQELMADAYAKAPATMRSIVEAEIKNGEEAVKKIVNELDAKTNEKLTQMIEQTEELVDDRIAQVKEEEKKELDDLSDEEKKYNIWIDHFYAAEDGGMTAINAHIRRRDPECSQFKGKFKLYVNKDFYRDFDLIVNGYDDVRKTFDKFFLKKGTYWITGVLTDDKGNKISNKQFKLIV